MRKWLPPLLLLLALIGLWELVVRAADVQDYLFPAPSAVAAALRDDAGVLWDATLVTAREMLLGYLLAVAVGLGFAVALHFSTVLRRALLPLLVVSQTVPTVVLAPILAILLGYGIGPEAGRRRDRLLLPDRRERGGRAARDRPGADPDDEDAARDALGQSSAASSFRGRSR